MNKSDESYLSIWFNASFRFISTLKAGCFCDLSVGIPLSFPIVEHIQRLRLLPRAVEVLPFDLDICHSISHFPLLLLPRLFLFASTHLDRRGGSLQLLPYAVGGARLNFYGTLQLLLAAAGYDGSSRRKR